MFNWIEMNKLSLNRWLNHLTISGPITRSIDHVWCMVGWMKMKTIYWPNEPIHLNVTFKCCTQASCTLDRAHLSIESIHPSIYLFIEFISFNPLAHSYITLFFFLYFPFNRDGQLSNNQRNSQIKHYDFPSSFSMFSRLAPFNHLIT